MSVIIVIALVGIVAALASAGVFMLRRPRQDAAPEGDKRMARALAVRVGVSVALFLLILLSWKMGWITPKGLPTGH
jgi:NADH:ubiquinone oxidoreductase subunit 6 (subunit J)